MISGRLIAVTHRHFINCAVCFVFAESVKNVLGKHVKILERRAVRMETKGDKTENRILVSLD